MAHGAAGMSISIFTFVSLGPKSHKSDMDGPR